MKMKCYKHGDNFKTFNIKVLGLIEGHTCTVKTKNNVPTVITYTLLEPLNKEALQTKEIQVEPPSPTQAQITDIT